MAILARINHHIAEGLGNLLDLFKKDEFVAIADYLDPNLVLFLNATTRDEALEEMIAMLEKKRKLKDAALFRQGIRKREEVVSTNIGSSVAIPHAKLEGYNDFFIAIGIQSDKGILWNSAHEANGANVHFVFMIGGPNSRQTEYLRILSELTTAIKSEERRKKLLKARESKEVIALFEGC